MENYKFQNYRSISQLVIRAPTSSLRTFGPLDSVLRFRRALTPSDPHKVDQHGVCIHDTMMHVFMIYVLHDA